MRRPVSVDQNSPVRLTTEKRGQCEGKRKCPLKDSKESATSREKRLVLLGGGAGGGALTGDSLLAEVLERWPSLTPQAQAQVLGLVRESTKQVAAK